MRLIKAIIEKGTDGYYSVYIPEIPGLYGAGKTEDEAKESLKDGIEMALEHIKETGDNTYYSILTEIYKIEYAYDLSGFFKTFNYFDVTAFAERIGVNSSLMRSYKTGKKKASAIQKNKILNGIHSVANELHAVRF